MSKLALIIKTPTKPGRRDDATQGKAPFLNGEGPGRNRALH